MREILAAASCAGSPLGYDDFGRIEPVDDFERELVRLSDEGLLEGRISFDGGLCLGGRVSGLTCEGKSFYKLIENGDVWAIVSETLRKADVDVSYPLLKEVCEEIVKRYVTSFIPSI